MISFYKLSILNLFALLFLTAAVNCLVPVKYASLNDINESQVFAQKPKSHTTYQVTIPHGYHFSVSISIIGKHNPMRLYVRETYPPAKRSAIDGWSIYDSYTDLANQKIGVYNCLKHSTNESTAYVTVLNSEFKTSKYHLIVKKTLDPNCGSAFQKEMTTIAMKVCAFTYKYFPETQVEPFKIKGIIQQFTLIKKFWGPGLQDNKNPFVADLWKNTATDTLYLTFKGTTVSEKKDDLADLDFFKTDCEVGDKKCGKVHRGFQHAYGLLKPKIFLFLKTLSLTLKVYVVGHSLGAAMATFAIYDIGNTFKFAKMHLITFGSPRCGDAHFKSTFNSGINMPIFTNWRYVTRQFPDQSISLRSKERTENFIQKAIEVIKYAAFDQVTNLPATSFGFIHAVDPIMIDHDGEPLMVRKMHGGKNYMDCLGIPLNTNF